MSAEAANNVTRRNGMISAMENMFRASIENDIGRMLWAWFDRALPIVTTGEGCGWDIRLEDGEPTNLNWLGQLVWADNRGLLRADAIPPFVEVQPPVPPTSDNIITNGQFLLGNTSGWNNPHGGARLVTGAELPTGPMPEGMTHAMFMPRGSGNGMTQNLQTILEPGTTYRLTAFGRNSSNIPAWQNQVAVQYHNNPASASGHNTYHTLEFSGNGAVNGWQMRTTTFTMPAGGFARAEVSIWSPNNATNDFWVTGILLEKMP